MGWLVIAMGSIAAALGAVYAYSGLDYIQIERGWTAVIAGMGLVSAGIIVIAIGILTLQLGKIVRLLKGATQSLAVEDGFLPDDEQPADEAQPEAAEAELAVADAPVAVSLPQAQGPVTPSARPDLSKQPPQPVKPDSGLPVEDKTSAAVTTSALSAEDRISLDWLEVAISDLKEPQGSAPVQARAENAAVPPQSVAAKPVVEVPSVAVSYTPPGAGLPRQKPFMPVMPDAAVKPQEQPKPEIAPPDRTKAAPMQTALPDPVKSEPLVHEPSVVGRYEAAGTSYAMYSDGSVEAENEHGIFRFGSMAELRAFIEQGQDQSASLPPQDV